MQDKNNLFRFIVISPIIIIPIFIGIIMLIILKTERDTLENSINNL